MSEDSHINNIQNSQHKCKFDERLLQKLRDQYFGFEAAPEDRMQSTYAEEASEDEDEEML